MINAKIDLRNREPGEKNFFCLKIPVIKKISAISGHNLMTLRKLLLFGGKDVKDLVRMQ